MVGEILTPYWTLTMVRSWVLVLCISSTYCTGKYNAYWYGGNPTCSDHLFTDSNAEAWWDKAENGCEGGRLYLPNSVNIPRDALDHLEANKFYWIGALQYSTWRWIDGTPLYSYAGYKRRLTEYSGSTVISHNSALQCHLHCENSQPFIGLRGRECYCLSEKPQDHPENPESRCPGNYEEKCGNMDGISLYKIENITIEPKETGQCAYADLSFRLSYYLYLYQDEDCETKRSVACESEVPESDHSICVYKSSSNWMTANRSCNLLHVTDSNKEDLKEAMSYSLTGKETSTYWIGLRRVFIRRWLNGSEVLPQAEHQPSTEPLCLALHLSSSENITLEWRSCSEEMIALCEPCQGATTEHMVSSSPPGSKSTPASTLAPVFTSQHPDGDIFPTDTVPTTATEHTLPYLPTTDWSSAPEHTNTVPYIPTTARTIARKESRTKRHQDNRLQIITLRASVAVAVVLAIVLIALIVTYRKEKARFRKNSSGTFLYLQRTSNSQVPVVPTHESPALAAVPNNQETTSFMKCDRGEDESYNVMNYDSKNQCKDSERDQTYNHLSESNYQVASSAGVVCPADSAHAAADDTMGNLFGQKTNSGNCSPKELCDTQHKVIGQGHVFSNQGESNVYDKAGDWKSRETKPNENMYDHTSSNGADGFYDMAGREKPRAHHVENYAHMNRGKGPVWDLEGPESSNTAKNTSTEQNDPVYGNDQVSGSTTTTSPESVYSNMNVT